MCQLWGWALVLQSRLPYLLLRIRCHEGEDVEELWIRGSRKPSPEQGNLKASHLGRGLEGGRVFPSDVDDVASVHPDGIELSSENLVAEILLNIAPPPPLHLHLHLQRETGERRRSANSGRLS